MQSFFLTDVPFTDAQHASQVTRVCYNAADRLDIGDAQNMMRCARCRPRQFWWEIHHRRYSCHVPLWPVWRAALVHTIQMLKRGMRRCNSTRFQGFDQNNLRIAYDWYVGSAQHVQVLILSTQWCYYILVVKPTCMTSLSVNSYIGQNPNHHLKALKHKQDDRPQSRFQIMWSVTECALSSDAAFHAASDGCTSQVVLVHTLELLSWIDGYACACARAM